MSTTAYPGRGVERLIRGQETQDGAGVKLTRVLTQDLQQRLDPFLMLDAFGSDKPDDYIAGFPNHPHRGFETITYMIAGRMRHRDSAGNEGLLQNGGVQWMTAGFGLTHSEMPEQVEGRMEGFQLWLNLPSQQKLCKPSYQDIQSAQIPEVTTAQGVLVRVIAGQFEQCQASIQREITQPLYLDLHFSQEAVFEHTIPRTHNAFVYVYRGELNALHQNERSTIALQRMAIFDNHQDRIYLHGQAGSRAIVIAGKPLQKAIVQYGPFVMNTREEIMQAVEDFRAGRMQ